VDRFVFVHRVGVCYFKISGVNRGEKYGKTRGVERCECVPWTVFLYPVFFFKYIELSYGFSSKRE